MSIEDSLDLFFSSDFAVKCIKPDASVIQVILDIPDQELFSDMIMSSDIKITGKTSDLNSLNQNDIIMVDGTQYTVKKIKKIDDGKISEAYLGSYL